MIIYILSRNSSFPSSTFPIPDLGAYLLPPPPAAAAANAQLSNFRKPGPQTMHDTISLKDDALYQTPTNLMDLSPVAVLNSGSPTCYKFKDLTHYVAKSNCVLCLTAMNNPISYINLEHQSIGMMPPTESWYS